MPFSRYFGTLQLAIGYRQVRQIVQSQLNLDDLCRKTYNLNSIPSKEFRVGA